MQLARLIACSLGLALLTGAAAFAATTAAPLTAGTPVVVPGGPGAFDWMVVDAPMHRLFASHKGTGNTAVLDLATGAILPSVATGKAQGIAIDEADNKIFAGDADEEQVVVLDRKTLQPTNQIKVTGPVDAVAYDPKNGLVYADHDDGTEVWVIDARTEKVVGTVEVGGAPEFIEYDPKTDRLYQNVKTTNSIVVIDPAANKAIATWSTAPMKSPHGLAVDSKRGRLYSAGSGMVITVDLKTGKIQGTVAIAPGSVDQIAFDSKRDRLYCACGGASMISVLAPAKSGLKLLGNVPGPTKAHTLAIDPESGDLWVSYTDPTGSYLQKFTPAH